MARISFLKKIQSQPVLFDGAMGSLLAERGLLAGDCPELWNRTQAHIMAEIHRAYADAGAQVVTTNTLGASRIGLKRHGLADQVSHLNRRAAQIAREVCPHKVYVAGSVGPTGELPSPLGKITFDQLVVVFSEQISALVEGGVDLICVEGMSELHEARAAVTAARNFPRLPVLATMVFIAGGQGFRTTAGVDPQSAALELAAAGAHAIGCSCGHLTLKQMGQLVAELRTLTKLPVIAQPNAGKPKVVAGSMSYALTPQQLAEGADQLLRAGATMVGGCCGTTPEHISAMAMVPGLAIKRKERRPS
jgi:5-methyltetrahydrofolate--homocysteine methyltransferase